MTFCLEAVYAFHGDALILHYGPGDGQTKRLLIDGGARGTYKRFLKKRLEQLKDDQETDDDLPVQMVMVSHTDSDHIAGVLDLFKDLENGNAPVQVGGLWHNSFDDIIGNENQDLISALTDGPDGSVEVGDFGVDALETQAVVQSVKQGRDLRNDAETLAIASNPPFVNAQGKPGLILATDTAIPQGNGMTLQVLAPDKTRVEAYQKKWNEYLKSKDLAEVRAADFDDNSAFNLASIVVLARMDGKTMLLTGDARGDHIVNALVEAALLEPDMGYPERIPGQKRSEWKDAIAEAEAKNVPAPFHVDLLKVAHHGSANNATVGFFKRVTADHYVFSGNGNHHNPDPETLEMLAEARNNSAYTLYFTFTADQHLDPDINPGFAKCLKEVHEWVETKKPDNCRVVYREPGADIYSVWVELAA